MCPINTGACNGVFPFAQASAMMSCQQHRRLQWLSISTDASGSPNTVWYAYVCRLAASLQYTAATAAGLCGMQHNLSCPPPLNQKVTYYRYLPGGLASQSHQCICNCLINISYTCCVAHLAGSVLRAGAGAPDLTSMTVSKAVSEGNRSAQFYGSTAPCIISTLQQGSIGRADCVRLTSSSL